MAWLKQQPQVARILHPSESDQPGHAVWRRDFSGSAGVFGLVMKAASREAQAAALAAMRHIQIGASWGGVHSLIAPSDPRKGRNHCDWLPDGPYWRLSIGLENADDIIADLDEALATLSGKDRRQATGAVGQAAE
jgi:cysteine-S-conjugate beta-lyase